MFDSIIPFCIALLFLCFAGIAAHFSGFLAVIFVAAAIAILAYKRVAVEFGF